MTTSAAAATNSAESIYASLGARSDKKTSNMKEAEDRFLTLLTTQLRNQDPLNPLDNAQLTSQLAQINTVNGIEKLNATLKTLLDSSAGTQTLQAATLVGRSVLVPGSALTLNQGMGLAGVELAGAADGVTATIKDANGLVVRTLDLGKLDAGVHGFAWDGKTDSGAQAADGAYSISLVAKQGQDKVTASALAVGTVAGVARSGSNGLTLDVGTLGAYALADVKQIF